MSGGPEPAGDLAGLYREAVKRHAADPVGYRAPIEATHRYEAYNALCGDRVEISLRVTGEQIEAAAFEGEACAICRASASMLCGLAPARPVAWLRSLSARLHQALGGSETTLPEELEPLLGVRRYPSRRRCATLPWEAAVNALDQPAMPTPDAGSPRT